MNWNMHQPEHNGEEELAAPEKLVAALKRVPSRVPFIPPAVDGTVLRAARRQLAPRTSPTLFGFKLMRWAAGAAVVCGVAIVLVQMQRSSLNPFPGGAFAREDVNHDGRVDILDAFALARQLKTGRGAAPPWLDVNGDGVVDERDVTAIAAHAVQLPKGGRS
ncbi:MAG TPA: dockerin type I domain-containing protein [Verrucomicrobiae bacterium]